MGQIIEIIMQIALVAFLSWFTVQFAKCMRLASYHPEVMEKKAESKE